MSTQPTVPLGSPVGTPPSGAPAQPPAPPAGGDEIKTTLDRLHQENERLSTENRRVGSAFGRIRSELGLPQDATEAQVSEALARLKVKPTEKPKKPGAAKPGAPTPTDEEGTAFSEDDILRARTEATRETETRLQQALADKDTKIASLERRLRNAHAEFEVTRKCEEMGLNSKLVVATLAYQGSGLEWDLAATEEEVPDGDPRVKVQVVSRKQRDRAYYSTEHGKHLELGDALAELAKQYPGVVLVQPQSGTGAGQNRQRGPVSSRKDPSQMSEVEKVGTLFGSPR